MTEREKKEIEIEKKKGRGGEGEVSSVKKIILRHPSIS